MEKVFKIFVDFDGTITQDDIGEDIFREFGDKEIANEIIEDLLNDRISAKECWVKLCINAGKVNESELSAYVVKKEIDSSFHEFVNFCKDHSIKFFVLSDGFDFYINRIFSREGLSEIEVFCNKLEIINNRLIPIFPYEDEGCRSSANCKRNHIINNSADEEYTVYIGDGNSDKYTAQFCDFIFAKDNLLKFCEKERITYFPYKNFTDVVNKLNELISKKRLKKRHQAELKRREVYMAE